MAIGGSKHFGFVKLRPDLQPVKVVTVTLGHPVEAHTPEIFSTNRLLFLSSLQPPPPTHQI